MPARKRHHQVNLEGETDGKRMAWDVDEGEPAHERHCRLGRRVGGGRADGLEGQRGTRMGLAAHRHHNQMGVRVGRQKCGSDRAEGSGDQAGPERIDRTG